MIPISLCLQFCQVVNLALGSLRTADAEDLPLIVKFLLQSATSTNVKQIVQKLRENLQFVTVSDVRAFKPDRKQKGKSSAPSSEALILDAIQSGLQVQNVSKPIVSLIEAGNGIAYCQVLNWSLLPSVLKLARVL